MRLPFQLKEASQGIRLNMGVKEAREFSRLIIYREILDDMGKEEREATPWERIIFSLRQSVAQPIEDHERWMAFLRTPVWVHELRATYLDDWIYFPLKESQITPTALGKKFGEWYGKSRIVLEVLSANPQLAGELIEFGLEPYDDEGMLDGLMQEIFIPYQSKILKHRASMVGRCSRLAALGSHEDAIDYFSGFATGQKTARKLLNEKAFEIYKEREYAARLLAENWEQVERMASRSEARDFVASRLPARMRGSLSNENGLNAFHERMLALFKQIGLNLTGRGKPPQNGTEPD